MDVAFEDRLRSELRTSADARLPRTSRRRPSMSLPIENRCWSGAGSGAVTAYTRMPARTNPPINNNSRLPIDLERSLWYAFGRCGKPGPRPRRHSRCADHDNVRHSGLQPDC